jgi:hypothetical protein
MATHQRKENRSMNVYMTADEATHEHTASLVNTTKTISDLPLRSIAAILAGHRTRQPLTPTQRAAALEHRRLLQVISAAGHDITANLEGFLSAYTVDQPTALSLAA